VDFYSGIIYEAMGFKPERHLPREKPVIGVAAAV
jgi:hypothetical protein